MAFGREPRPMSTPISAAMTSALSWLTPGIMLEDCDRRAKGLDVGVDLLVNLGDGGIDGVDVLEQRAQSKAMMLGHTAPQRGLQFGRCRFDPPMRQRRQRLWVGLAADQGLDHPPAGQAGDVGDDRIELNVGVLQRLLETLDMAAALAHELLAHPQDVAHLLKSVPPARSCRG